MGCAACSARHYRVNKVGRKDDVATELTHLDAVGRVEELARMLGGREITSKARAHARELLAQSHEAKSSRP